MARYGMVIDMRTCVGCQACMVACTAENQTPFWSGKFRTHVEDKEQGSFPDVRRTLLPRLCMHCENTPCLSACPTGATYMNKDGVILVNFDRCIGCYACCIACPYDARFPYENEDVQKEHELYGKSVTHEMPHVDKCTFCAHRLAENRDPACVSTCPTHTRIFGDLDDLSSEVHKMATSGKAQVLNPGLGTSPKVFYIPS